MYHLRLENKCILNKISAGPESVIIFRTVAIYKDYFLIIPYNYY